MDLDLFRKRVSVRRFESRPVEREKLEAIIDAARHAPTARNEQPWEFLAVTDGEVRKRIAEATDYGRFITEAPACIALFCRDTKYYLEDGSAAANSILLAATVLGLGTCWVAGDKKAYAEPIREMLGVPEGYKLVALIPVGYPAEHHPKEKRSLDEVLHWEGWS